MAEEMDDLLKYYRDQSNKNLWEISFDSKTLVVFLRHTGCVFCREALSDISKLLKNGQLKDFNIVLVHMSHDPDARSLFTKYDLGSVSRIADRDQKLYRAFGLKRGNIIQLFGPKNWVRGLSAIFTGYFQAKVDGDGYQMPGIFIIYRGEIIRSFIHKSASDRPDYKEFASCKI